MQTKANPFMRADTLFGTCQAIGEDFGFNPLILRIAFAVGLFWSAKWTFVVYAGLSVVVLASRLVFADRTPRAAQAKPATPAQALAQAENDESDRPQALAA